jgi:hypothetical protein
LFLFFGLLVVMGSIAASAARLTFAIAPTTFSPELIERALAGPRAEAARRIRRLGQVLAARKGAEWESSLLSAVASEPNVRTGLVNELLTELDHRMQRWVRVPRVCASICTSAGFLLAAMLLRSSLSDVDVALVGRAVDAAVLQAIDVAALGLAGATFCIAAQVHARSAAALRAKAYDHLVDRLERTFDSSQNQGIVGGNHEGDKPMKSFNVRMA